MDSDWTITALKLVTLVAIFSVIILSLASTLFLDVSFLLHETQLVEFSSDLASLVVGGISAVYFFILPGVPLFVANRRQGFLALCKTFTLSITYSAFGAYVGTLILMMLGHAELSILIPLPLTLLSSIVFLKGNSVRTNEKTNEIDTRSSNPLRLTARPPFLSAIVLCLLILFVLVRFVVFSGLVVECSDGLEYQYMILDISTNNYLFNPYHSRWAPAYPLYGFLVSRVGSTPLVSLKAVSFFFSIASLFPMLVVYDSIPREKRTKRYAMEYALVLFWCYPWMNVLSSVNLQDTTVTFFVISFIALILSKDAVHKTISGLAAGLAFVLRYSLGLLGPLGLMFLLTSKSRPRGLQSIKYVTAWLTLIVPWITRNLVVTGVFLSRSDESLFDPGNITPNLTLVTQSQAMILLNLMGTLPLILCFPLVAALLVKMWKPGKRGVLLKSFFTRELVLLYAICAAQFAVLFMFETLQMRFMLSVAWAFPILWMYYATHLEIPRIDALVSGWIFWSFAQTAYLLRTYWYLTFTRLPAQDWSWPYVINPNTPPPLHSWLLSGLFLALMLFIPVVLGTLGKRRAAEPIHSIE